MNSPKTNCPPKTNYFPKTNSEDEFPEDELPPEDCSPKTNYFPKINSEDEFPEDLFPEDELLPEDEFWRRIPRRRIAPRRRITSRRRIAKTNSPKTNCSLKTNFPEAELSSEDGLPPEDEFWRRMPWRLYLPPEDEFLAEDELLPKMNSFPKTRPDSVAFENVRWRLHTCPRCLCRQRFCKLMASTMRGAKAWGTASLACSAHNILWINCVASVSVSLFRAFFYHFPKRPRCQKKFRTDTQSYDTLSCKLRYAQQVGICRTVCLWARWCVATPGANERNIAEPPSHQIHIFLGFKEEGEQGLD